jgi:protein arginine kinase activator
MKQKCDKCDKPATIHLTEITAGEKVEKHLCEDCAAAEGITVKANVPISQLLEDFVLQATDVEPGEVQRDQTCDACGMSLSEFRENGLLGCSHDYDAFSDTLLPMIARAHDGATQHVGKVPPRADQAQRKQAHILRLRTELQAAIQAEQYERAASLRDQIRDIETQ